MAATVREFPGQRTPDPSADEVLAACREDDVQFVNLQFTDITGVVKMVTIPVDVFPGVIVNGQWFDGSSIAGFARIAESDMFLMPDLSTFTVVPWERGRNTTARVICWVHRPDGELFPGDPRAVLLRQLERLANLGFVYHTGPEVDLSTDLAAEVRKDMVRALQGMGIAVEATHHETAIGQHEIDFEYADAMTSADQAITFKFTLKAIAQQHGLHATFMPKPIEGIAGSGMHTHQSLARLEPGNVIGENVFVDQGDPYGLSPIARQFLAGQLAHIRGMTAVLNPLVNSYRRLVPGFEAPVYVSWARQNRSALIRVPTTRMGRHVGTLPATLGEAIAELARDDVVKAALGEHVYERLSEAQTREWRAFCHHVTAWERARYMEIY
ncbi:MAG TPA: glutamine synthetase family protein [Thermomicrobiales bacterium]|nr:glutamine synthetase family protein [Thermomicrobiales bacterium]